MNHYLYLHDPLPHSQRQKPHALLYNHKGEQMSPEIRSEIQRLNKKQLLGVCRLLFQAIVNIVTTSPTNPTTRKKATNKVIAMLDSKVIGSWHQDEAEKAEKHNFP